MKVKKEITAFCFQHPSGDIMFRASENANETFPDHFALLDKKTFEVEFDIKPKTKEEKYREWELNKV